MTINRYVHQHSMKFEDEFPRSFQRHGSTSMAGDEPAEKSFMIELNKETLRQILDYRAIISLDKNRLDDEVKSAMIKLRTV